MAVRLSGDDFSQKILQQLKIDHIDFVNKFDRKAHLAVILVGDDPASQVYVRNKAQKAEAIGFASTVFALPESTSQQELLELIDQLNQDNLVDGILVQLPLPKSIDSNAILLAIDPKKDVDGFHPINIGLLWSGKPRLVPCTPLGCLLILKDYLGSLSGKKAVIIGRSNIVGKPMAALLLAENATVSVCHSKTENLIDVTKNADILVVAVGMPKLVKKEYVKKGAVILDVGINRLQENSKSILVGDVDYDDCFSVAGAITPVPKGIGPLTIACLLKNTLQCAYLREQYF